MEANLGNMQQISPVVPLLSLLRPTATAILVAGDAAVASNQIDCRVGGENQYRLNTVVAGLTARVTDNLFSGPFVQPAIRQPAVSAITWGMFLNTTTGNQATHCILAAGLQKNDQGNLSIACPLPAYQAEEPQPSQIMEGSVEGVLHWVCEHQCQPPLYPFAEVELTSPAPGFATIQANADENGHFEFAAVPSNVPLIFRFSVFLGISGGHSVEHVEAVDAEANQHGNVVAIWQKLNLSTSRGDFEGHVEGRLVFRPGF